ncbi:MAG: type II toxin-antitoxin system prevent-host-death family antitoxin, partial [Peptococcaceae bacterium]
MKNLFQRIPHRPVGWRRPYLSCRSVLKNVDCQKKRVVITKRGKPIAAVISIMDQKKQKPRKAPSPQP